jgi:hypothetical protein
VPTIPAIVKASGPATGFSASAAWAEVSMPGWPGTSDAPGTGAGRGSYRRTATPAGYDDWEHRRFDRRRLLHDDPFRSFGHGGLATVHVSRKKREKDIRDRSTSADHLSHLWKLRTASCGTGACHHVWSELPSTSC